MTKYYYLKRTKYEDWVAVPHGEYNVGFGPFTIEDLMVLRDSLDKIVRKIREVKP